MLIGHRQQEVYALESSGNALFLQVSNQESHIDDQSMADVMRLQKEFEKEMLREQKRIRELNNSFDAFDKAINYILAGKEEREWEISTWRKYQEMKKALQLNEARDEAGRQRYEQEQEEQRLEAQKQAQEDTEKQTHGRSVYYN